ncbi:hypothetical protein ABEP42_27165 [Priestia megaterium]|uniref:hypothetical protein n=1 Tax=Priestia megaterium TaxID=1404 RepID=UPI0031776ED2
MCDEANQSIRRYRVGLYRENGVTGVGIERINDAGEVDWIGSYYCGDWSRRDVCVFYISKIRSQLGTGEIAKIKVADLTLIYKGKWYRHYQNIKLYAISKDRYKSARKLAADAVARKYEMEENY